MTRDSCRARAGVGKVAISGVCGCKHNTNGDLGLGFELVGGGPGVSWRIDSAQILISRRRSSP